MIRGDLIEPFYLDLTDDEIQFISEGTAAILKSGQLILGKHTETFECKFSRYIGTKYAVAFNSCTAALETMLTIKLGSSRIYGNTPRANLKVAVPSNTNFASVASIIRSGACPIYMDMDPDYFAPGYADFMNTFGQNPDISGVMWVHIGGVIHPEFCKIVDFCRGNGIFVIEDDAHAHGSSMGGVKAGNMGDGGCFSFFPTKVMTTIEGGIVTTNSEEERDILKSFRNQGKRGQAFGGLHHDLGNSWRISEISALIGLVQLKKLDSMVQKRMNAVRILEKALDDLGVTYCRTDHMDASSQYKFIIKYDKKPIGDIKEDFKRHGIILGGAVYEVPCHLQPVFEPYSGQNIDLADTEKFCPNHFCPPVTSGTTEEDANKISTVLKKIL